MVREVITLNVGQCGIQMVQTIWEQYCAEHEIDETGKKYSKICEDAQFLSFFEETDKGQYVPRNLMIDLEPSIIDDVKNSKYSQIFHLEFLLAGNEDAENNFARGHYSLGPKIIDRVNEKLRKLVDKCDNVQGFIMNHSVGGGTGSGLGCLILEKVAVDYRMKDILGFEVYPSSLHSNCVTDVYNSLLSTHWSLDHKEVSVVYDNERMYEICQKNLNIENPSHHDINQLLSKHISGTTASLRFADDLNFKMKDFYSYLVPLHHFQFLIPSMSPIMSKYDQFESFYGSIDQSALTLKLNVPSIVNAEITEYTAPFVDKSIQEIMEKCVDSANFFVKIDGFDAEEDKYMTIYMNSRGDVNVKGANAAVQWLETNKKVTFVEWCPIGFNVGLRDKPLTALEDDNICAFEKSVSMLGNNTAIGRFFSKRISKKYDLMYSQRAYVHHYVAEGMEEEEFEEAREDLECLERHYLDVLNEQDTDSDYEDSSST